MYDVFKVEKSFIIYILAIILGKLAHFSGVKFPCLKNEGNFHGRGKFLCNTHSLQLQTHRIKSIYLFKKKHRTVLNIKKKEIQGPKKKGNYRYKQRLKSHGHQGDETSCVWIILKSECVGSKLRSDCDRNWNIPSCLPRWLLET